METIPEIIAFGTAVAGTSILMGLAFERLKRYLNKEAVYEVRLRHLNDEAVRRDLSAFLEKQQVVGDADIRAGRVVLPVRMDQIEPLAVVLSNAAAYGFRLLEITGNSNAKPLYIRNPISGEFLLLADLDLDHIIDAARLMQTMAENKERN
jgi:hypothetical protein